ncbi:hypothetical protein LEMLEM_LOCUS26889 [Lemmus lemmus]
MRSPCSLGSPSWKETHVCTASDSRQTRGRCAEVELGREATLQTAAVCTAPLRP